MPFHPATEPLVNGYPKSDSSYSATNHNGGSYTNPSNGFKPGPRPVAVCGMALRLPGGISNTSELWDALQNRRDMRGAVPDSRYSSQGFSNSLGSKGAIKTEYGYFLDQNIASFDSSLFSLTEEEAKRTDPQQRILLEVVKECLENAKKTDYRGRNIGCYVGTFGEDWLQSQSKEDQHSGGYIMSGQIDLMVANRVSFENDLRGPSMVIKTGCSASLTALHEACRALQMNDCTGAIVAGTNLILGPTTTAAMASEEILSPEGSCKTFDSDADGFARGEAITAVYLELLDVAVKEHLPVRAVITNTGVNCDGRSKSLLQPSAESQIDLMRKVHGDLGSDPTRTAFVECHGTGTSTGDPIECLAVGEVFGSKGVYIGSIKPNLGHSEGASGLSSLLKSILMLEKGMILPNIKFNSPNPKIDFKKNGLRVPQKLTPWPADRDLRVAINSFGIGGSNAHVIVEHPYTHCSNTSHTRSTRFKLPQILPLSASTSSSLQTFSEACEEYVKTHPGCLPNLAYNLARRRELYQYRSFAIWTDENNCQLSSTIKAPAKEPSVTMVFNGQGAQWVQMCQELLEENADFLRDIQFMDRVLQELKYPPKWTIEAEMKRPAGTSRIKSAEISQPLCTALQVALFRMLLAGGVRPNAVIGHSSGEIAAAYACGGISMEEAIIIAYYRGYITRTQSMKGGMAAVGLDSKNTSMFLEPGVVIACENSPSSTTISGDEATLTSILKKIKEHHNGVLVWRLNVDLAYHSQHMNGFSTIYKELLQNDTDLSISRRKELSVPMFSSVWNQKIISAETFSPEYWVANLVSPVRFSAAMSNLLREEKDNLIVEIGPHSVLAGPLRQICSAADSAFNYVPTLIRSSHDTLSMLTTFGTLYQHGLKINWDNVVDEGELLTDLPVQPWDHSVSYWYESRVSRAWRTRKFGHHELLGLRVPQTTDRDPIWRVALDLEDVPWLADHKVKDDIVVPFAAYISMAGEAFRQFADIEEGYCIYRTRVKTAMVLDIQNPLEVVTSLHSVDTESLENMFEFRISSYSGSTWIQHCKGLVGAPKEPGPLKLGMEMDAMKRKVVPRRWYEAMGRLGLVYGSTFRRIEKLTASTNEMIAVAKISNSLDYSIPRYTLHPTTIDASFQVGLAALTKGLCRNFVGPQMPTSIEELQIFRGNLYLDCTSSYSVTTSELSSTCMGTNGKTCLSLRGMKLTSLTNDDLEPEKYMHGAAHLEWVADYDFLDPSTLVQTPHSSNHMKAIIEELALLCIVESSSLLENISPSKPHFLKYRSWLKRTREEALADKHPVLKDTKKLMALSEEARGLRLKELCQEASSSSLGNAFAEGILRIRNNIQQIFLGETDTLELLMREDNLARIYDSVSFNYSDFIRKLSDKTPNLRILEIGAGTGGTTELILRGMQGAGENFPRYSKYTFTDISAGFFPKARERFVDAPNMEFKIFDISQDPFEQGFDPESYDLILAANVVHATPSLAQTLKNLQPILSSNGLLVLTEFCTLFRAPNYIYGNFSGWWLGEEDDRKWEPYVDIPRWNKELKLAGFSGTSNVVLDAAEPYQYCGTIISQKREEGNELAKNISILCEDAEATSNQALFNSLEKQGFSPRFVALGEASRLEGDIISSLDLEGTFFENISEDNFHGFQNLCRRLKDRKILWLMRPAQVNCTDPSGSQTLGMIRTARCELDISITTLEVDLDIPKFPNTVIDVYRNIESQKNDCSLAPDREFVVHENVVKVGRYRPFELHQTSTNISVSPKVDNTPHLEDNTLHGSPIAVDQVGTYMMTGGLGGLGRAMAVWLVERGARNLIFLSPSAGLKQKNQELFEELKSMGCTAIAIPGLVQNEADVLRAISAAKTPIKGLIHLAMQLRDAMVLDMSIGDWHTVLFPKADGTWNLHRNLGVSLDFFVMTSSLSTVINQPGQSNYNAANTFMESFCQYRHSLGLPASILNVCPIEGVGYVAENSDAHRKLKSQGHCFLDERTLLEFLEMAIRNSQPVEPKCDVNTREKPWRNNSHIVMGLRSEIPLDDPSNNVTWRRDRRMGLYHNILGGKLEPEKNEGGKLKEFLTRAKSQIEILDEKASEEYLAMEIGKRAFQFMMKPEEDLEISLSLAEVGVDSLMAIELRRWWKQAFGVEASVLEIMSCGTIEELGKLAARSLRRRIFESS